MRASSKLSRMMQPRKGKREDQQQNCDDRISYLSDDILVLILSQIPLREAVRTSVLSKRWTYLWCSIPSLELDMNLINDEGDMRKWVYIVHRILDSRDCQYPILSCTLYIENRVELMGDFDEFVLFLCKNGIQDLYLKNHLYLRYELPMDACFCQSLKKLTLAGCKVVLPPLFEGISCLVALTFRRVSITDEDLERFISSCQLLESFCLDDIFFGEFEVKSLRITALNLRSLEIHPWRSTHISLKDAPLLENVSYSTCNLSYDNEAKMLVELLRNLGHMESLKLELFLYSSKSLHRLILPKSLHALKLKKLTLHVDSDVARLLSCLLGSCPKLQELNIVMHKFLYVPGRPKKKGFFAKKYWEKQGPFECLMYHLTTVRIKMDYLNNNHCGIGFMAFLLKNAYVLKRMSISYSMSLKKQLEAEISELFLLQRASPHVVLELNSPK